DDGSWPIDTNLATWVTTLSVNALANDPSFRLAHEQRRGICDWLLAQQYREVHPYTRASPGGWAWTDLPGGVPDADDTAGAVLALGNMRSELSEVGKNDLLTAARSGIRWLRDVQNRDGGIPTFCRGWGALPFDRSSADITAHAIRAGLAWRDDLSPAVRKRLDTAIGRAVKFLCQAQRSDGAWVPLWFGNQFAPGDENPTYGTARVLNALQELTRADLDPASVRPAGRAISLPTDAL